MSSVRLRTPLQDNLFFALTRGRRGHSSTLTFDFCKQILVIRFYSHLYTLFVCSYNTLSTIIPSTPPRDQDYRRVDPNRISKRNTLARVLYTTFRPRPLLSARIALPSMVQLLALAFLATSATSVSAQVQTLQSIVQAYGLTAANFDYSFPSQALQSEDAYDYIKENWDLTSDKIDYGVSDMSVSTHVVALMTG